MKKILTIVCILFFLKAVHAQIIFPEDPINLGENINSKEEELLPIVSPDGKTLYFALRKYSGKTDEIKESEDIYYAYSSDGKNWSKAISIGKPLNNVGSNFVCSITPDGNTILVGNTYDNEGFPAGKGASLSYRNSAGWTMPIPIKINNFYNNGKTVSYFMADNRKVLLMSLQREDALGDNDLYVSFWQSCCNEWSSPVNLGNIVNTNGKESYPFLASDGLTLYYSTDGNKDSFGKQDIYMTRRLDKTWKNWSKPINLGNKINSENNDNGFTIPASAQYAYFSSARNSLGRRDIFRIFLPKELRPKPVILVKGKVLNKETGQPVQANISVRYLENGEEEAFATSSPVDGSYEVILPSGHQYSFYAELKGYFSTSGTFDARETETFMEMNQNLYLDPIKKDQVIVLNNIFFAFAKSDLLPESHVELEKLIKILKENESIQIEISGHTDKVGNYNTNKLLSNKRAKSVVDYLSSSKHSIPNIQQRIKYSGYGSDKPVCKEDREDCYKQNRRVEFKVLEVQ